MQKTVIQIPGQKSFAGNMHPGFYNIMDNQYYELS